MSELKIVVHKIVGQRGHQEKNKKIAQRHYQAARTRHRLDLLARVKQISTVSSRSSEPKESSDTSITSCPVFSTLRV